MSTDTYISNYNVLLMDYAAGTLDQAQSMIIAAHLGLSPMAREIVYSCESIGGALIENHCEPVAMNQGSLEKILNGLNKKTEQPQQPQVASRPEIFPEDLCELPECVQSRVSCKPKTQLKWRRVQRGIHSFALPLECRRSKASMFRLDPGTATPRHTHRSLEITLIMDGGFEDETGWYKRGDLVISDPETPAHAPQACEKQGCIYMSVFSGPVRLIDPLEAFLNPFKRFCYYLPAIAGASEIFQDSLLLCIS